MIVLTRARMILSGIRLQQEPINLARYGIKSGFVSATAASLVLRLAIYLPCCRYAIRAKMRDTSGVSPSFRAQ